jgi:hypothetical protein
MPCIVGQFRAETITQRFEAGRQHRLNVRRRELQIDDPLVVTVNRCAECVCRTETVGWMAWCEIHGYGRGTRLALALTQDCDGLKRHSGAAQEDDKLQTESVEKTFFLV